MTIQEGGPGRPPGSRDRERAIARTFVRLADTLVDDYDVVDLLDRLAHAAVELLGAGAAGILLDDLRGRLAVVAASSAEGRLMELLEVQQEEGPCRDCVREGQPVVASDLEAHERRWPRFAAAAQEAGFRSVVAVPLRLRAQTIGGLSMLHPVVGAPTDDDQGLAQALADVATIGILQERNVRRSARLAEQLQRALDSRVVLEQAKGVFAERHHVSVDVSFSSLRQHARDHNLTLGDVARGVLNGALSPAVVHPDPSD